MHVFRVLLDLVGSLSGRIEVVLSFEKIVGEYRFIF